MPPTEVVRFTVRWGTAARVLQMVFFLFFAAIALGWAFLAFSPTIPWHEASAGTVWGLRAFLPLFVACALIMLGLFRFRVWLDGYRLVRQAALWRISVDLRTARFAMTQTSWEYTRRFGPASFARVKITAPTLVVRASALRRIKLPLVRRSVQRTADGRYVASWLPTGELRALADAIDEYATAPGKDKVAAFIRNLQRSPVQPNVSFGSPF